MSAPKNKRFYKTVSVVARETGFGITLDGRDLKTPAKNPLSTEYRHVAELIVEEWDAQVELIRPETMPVTRLVNVALEVTPNNRTKLIAEARSYGATDLLCYRASDPPTLVERQSKHWDPVLDWAESRKIHLTPTQSIRAIAQAETSLDQIADYASQKDDLNLTLLVHLTAVYGSVILAIAVMERHLDGAEAYALSRLDALYQIEQWGEDEEAVLAAKAVEEKVVALCRILEGDLNG